MGFHIFFLVDSLVQHLRDIERDNRVRYGRYGWGKVDAAAVGGSGPAFAPSTRGEWTRQQRDWRSPWRWLSKPSQKMLRVGRVRSSIDGLGGASWRRQMPCVDGGVGRNRGRYLTLPSSPRRPPTLKWLPFLNGGETISSLTTYEFVVDDIIDGGRLDVQVD